LFLSGIDHCQAGIQAEDKACAARESPHLTGSLLWDSHCCDWKTVGQNNAEDGIPTFIASATCSFPPAFSLQTGTMTSTWHKVKALTSSFTFDKNLWVGLDFNKIMLAGANYTDKIQE
jgi:hypothetical protein